MTTSLQDILRRRQQEEFVGREEQLAFFRRNLRYAPDDDRRRFIISISGQGGVGKTWLLRRFRQIAEGTGAITACTDEAEEDVPGVMGCLAEHFEAQGHKLKTFAERYAVYQQRKNEIEADPEAPQGFPALVGRTLARGSLHLVRRAPGVGLAAEFVDEETFADLGGEFASYVARKIKNKDEVHLVLETADVLTPLLLADLQEIAEEHTIVLFFDTYERTGEFLDPWLRDLLEGRHGDVPADILLVVAGRDGLDRNHWSPYEGALTRLPLDPFTEEEARDYVVRKGVTDERVIDVILGLSGRLPLLVATLAAESPDDPDEVGDPSGEAVERFLSWVDDPEQRQAALDAALPRRLNRDVLVVLAGEEQARPLFAWLKGRPFVEKRGDGWGYHDVVRAQMLRYKRQESPQGWANLHGRLAGYCDGLRDGLGLEEEAGRKDETWQRHALEVLYHHLCQAPQTQLTAALNGFLAALEASLSFAGHWAEVIRDAGEDADAPSMQQQGRQLVEGMKAFVEERYQGASEMFTALLEQADIEVRWQAVALGWRGIANRRMRHYEEALADLDRAIKLEPDLDWAIVHRGITYRDMERYEEALADFHAALELDVDQGWVFANRGVAHRMMERYGEALADFDQAIDLRPDMIWPIADRGRTYRLMGQYDAALADFDRAIELDPNLTWALVRRGMAYRDMERYEEALADFNSALELDVDQGWVFANRGVAYRMMERYEEALADFDRAIELRPDMVWPIASRGRTYRLMGQYDAALADFGRAIELEPDLAWAIVHRGITYRDMERYEEALADFGRAIELDPDLAWAIASRGETYRMMERYKESLADFDRAIELASDLAWAIAARGAVYLLMGSPSIALGDFNRALELNPDDDLTIIARGLTHQLMEEFPAAQADLAQAIYLTRQVYQEDPHNWRNTLYLAIYHLTVGEAEETERLCREALAGGASPYHIRATIRNLGDFLALFPDHPEARAMRNLLQEHLEESER